MRERLKAARQQLGLTRLQMADKLELDLEDYKKIEFGDAEGTFEIWDILEDITRVHQRLLRKSSREDEMNEEDVSRHRIKVYEHYGLRMPKTGERGIWQTKDFEQFVEVGLPLILKERMAGKYKMSLYYDPDFPAYVISFDEYDSPKEDQDKLVPCYTSKQHLPR